MRSKLAALPWLILLLPIDLVVVLALLLGKLCAFLRNPVDPTVQGYVPSKTATIVIVNWDGKHLLAECLPSVIEAVKVTGDKHEILVVDNGSTDGSVQFLKNRFPEVRILSLDRNYGFGQGNNRAVREL